MPVRVLQASQNGSDIVESKSKRRGELVGFASSKVENAGGEGKEGSQ
jgi:hypothetical protein